MKKLTTILLTFLPILIWAHEVRAHKDIYYTYEYDNVTVRFKTGFFFEEINHAKIIGQYAALLSDSMDYDKPILLDFIHDYGYTYRGKTFSFLNFGSQKYSLLSCFMMDSVEDYVYYQVPFSDKTESLGDVGEEIYTVPVISDQPTMVIRQFGFHFDLTKTINLLYHAISNKSEVKKLSSTAVLSSYYRNFYYQFETVPSNFIATGKSLGSSFVNQVLQKKVYRETVTLVHDHFHYSYFSQNGKIHIFAGGNKKEIVLDTLDNIYSFNPRDIVPELLFVFSSPNQFRKYELIVDWTWKSDEFKFTIERSNQHIIPIDQHEFISQINIEWLGDDIYFINYNNSFISSPFVRYLYLELDDVVIEDFEKFINSYRKN